MNAASEPTGNEGLDPVALGKAISTIKDMLALSEDRADIGFLARLKGIVRNYTADRSIQPFYGNPAEQRRLILQLAGSLKKSLLLLQQVAPEYLISIEDLLDVRPLASNRTNDMTVQLDRLADAVQRFADAYTPKRGAAPDLPLEEAIRELVPLFADHVGGRVAVAMNKSKGGSPALASPEAIAVGLLLRVAEPKLSDAKLANMIQKVRREPEPSTSHLEAIWDTDPRAALDEALIPRRGGGD